MLIRQHSNYSKNLAKLIKKYYHGFMSCHTKAYSLLEMLVTLTLVGITITIAAPTFSNLFTKKQAVTKIDKIKQLITLAKNYAKTRHVSTTICPYQNNTTCAANWNHGMLLFSDSNSNHKFDSDDKTIKHLNSFPTGANLTLKAFPSKKYLQFNSHGLLNSSNGTFTYTNKNSATSYKLIISKTGRIRLDD